jgi:8-amino-7-oxononanoate synthase
VSADFTSSLFLGYRHDSLPAWRSLTTGVPAALRPAAGADRVAASVASAVGAECGLVARSTLHALTDVLGTLPGPGDVVAIDEAAYPVAVAAMGATGASVVRYPHHRPPTVQSGLQERRRVFVVTDGWCPGCNRPAPLAALRRAARGGAVVVDDTLAFGVLPAGTTGLLDAGQDGIVWVASLAKAYGAPLAVVTGDRATITRLAREGGNRWHSSPSSAADLAAAAAALGDRQGARVRRLALAANVRRVRAAVHAAGLSVVGQPFPVVVVPFPAVRQARQWCARLGERGVRTVVQEPRCRPGALLAILVRADHTAAELDLLADSLAGAAVAA